MVTLVTIAGQAASQYLQSHDLPGWGNQDQSAKHGQQRGGIGCGDRRQGLDQPPLLGGHPALRQHLGGKPGSDQGRQPRIGYANRRPTGPPEVRLAR